MLQCSFSFLDYKLAIFVRQALCKDKLNTTWCCLEFFHLGLASRFEGICIGHGRVGWRSVASEDAWDMGQRNGNSFYLAVSSQMAEFKEYLSIYFSLQRDFYPIKDMGMHPATSWCITFWDARKYLSKRLSSIFLSPKKNAAWAASRRMNDDAYCFLFDAVNISQNRNDFRWVQICGVRRFLKDGTNLYCKDLKISEKASGFFDLFRIVERTVLCGFLWRIVVWYSQAEPGAATAPLSPAAKWLGITFELQHSSKRFAFCFNQIAW